MPLLTLLPMLLFASSSSSTIAGTLHISGLITFSNEPGRSPPFTDPACALRRFLLFCFLPHCLSPRMTPTSTYNTSIRRHASQEGADHAADSGRTPARKRSGAHQRLSSFPPYLCTSYITQDTKLNVDSTRCAENEREGPFTRSIRMDLLLSFCFCSAEPFRCYSASRSASLSQELC